jgi:hypothetical protein
VKRTLTLKSETLAALTTDELTSVVGGQAPPTLPVAQCLDTLQATRCFCP